MPAVATTPDGATQYAAWYDTEAEDLIVGVLGDLTGLAIARPSPTPTHVGQPPAPPPAEECTPVVDGKVTVVAEGVAFTDGVCIQAPAGEPFTIVFDNRDAGVPHNVRVFTGPQTGGDVLFEGEIITGPSQIEYEIPALDPGEYAYDCTVHPNMIGRIVVGEGAGATGPTGPTAPPGGEEELTTRVVAENIAFDTQTIVLPAETEHTITFENRDVGVPHDIAIFTDPSLTTELFRGELVTGPTTVTYTVPPLPPGEYYFLCTVHPMMNGTVLVR
jgi:plastocyanin